MNALQKLVGRALGIKHVYSLADWGFPVPRLGSTWNPDSYIATAYHANAIAHACISRIAKDVAGVPLLYLRDPDDETSYQPDTDPVAALFAKPNQVFTTRRLMEWSTMLRMLRGEVFWKMETGGRNSLAAILPWYDPIHWREYCDARGLLMKWEFYQDKAQFTALPSDVLWMGSNDPRNPYRGLAPLRAASSAVGIDINADNLVGDMLGRGGERGMLFQAEFELTDEQTDQLRAGMAGRRPGQGAVSRDYIIPGSLTPLDPKMAREDIDYIATQTAAKKKICQVFGMAPVLIGDDDSAQYKSAPEAVKLYWNQTLIPLLRSYEDAWDKYFVHDRKMGTYVRFDLSGVQALREDERTKAETARIYRSMSIPLTLLNDKLDLGFAEEDMVAVDEQIAADRAAFNSSFSWGMGDDEREQDQDDGAKSLRKARMPSNAVIKARALDPIAKTQRIRIMNRLEMATWRAMQKVAVEYGKKAAEIVKNTLNENPGLTDATSRIVNQALDQLKAPLGEALAAVVAPAHRRAAEIGVVSIQDLLTGKAHEPFHERRKTVRFAPETERTIASRGRYISRNVPDELLDAVHDLVFGVVRSAGETGESMDWVARRVRERFEQFGAGQSATIARTEVGTMYNTSRFDEMGQQGFDHHEWLSSIDEATRETHVIADGETVQIGARFSMGLTYPQENSGPPEEVINCRCETIPVVKE